MNWFMAAYIGIWYFIAIDHFAVWFVNKFLSNRPWKKRSLYTWLREKEWKRIK